MTLTSFRQFSRSIAAVAAVEFAIILPFMLLLMIGGFEISRFLHLSFRVSQTAGNIGLILSQYTRVLKPDDIQLARNSAVLVTPELRRGRGPGYDAWKDRMQIDLARVEIKAVAGRGAYEAKPIWTSKSSRRTCNVLRPMNSGRDNYDPGAIPSALLSGAGSVVVVDVSFRYAPILGESFVGTRGSMLIERSVYIEPRQGGLIRYDNSDSSVANNCPS